MKSKLKYQIKKIEGTKSPLLYGIKNVYYISFSRASKFSRQHKNEKNNSYAPIHLKNISNLTLHLPLSNYFSKYKKNSS